MAALAEDGQITSVSSVTSPGYARVKRADGTLEPETYAFGDGGRMEGPVRDSTIDSLTFMKVAQTIADPLASQNYVPAPEPKSTNLLIMVYWGTTTGSMESAESAEIEQLQASQIGKPPPPPPMTPASAISSSGAGARSDAMMSSGLHNAGVQDFYGDLASVALQDHRRNQADAQNAALLGYDSELSARLGLEGTALQRDHDDLVDELEENRYFIVLMAYDFQVAWKDKKHKLLWVTRMSVRQKGNDFGKALPAMSRFAARYFGRNSNGLIRKTVPEGRVEIGIPKVLPDK
jgi:hypothetical protein